MCKSGNLIYCVTCKKCNKQYVGQTMNCLMDHFQGHWQTIQAKNTKVDIGRHFNLPNHQGTDDMKISVLEFVYADANLPFAGSVRNQIEFTWIQKLRTQLPMGINTMDRPEVDTASRNWRFYNSDIRHPKPLE